MVELIVNGFTCLSQRVEGNVTNVTAMDDKDMKAFFERHDFVSSYQNNGQTVGVYRVKENDKDAS